MSALRVSSQDRAKGIWPARWKAVRHGAGDAVSAAFSVAVAWPVRFALRQGARLIGAPRAFASADRRLLEDCILPFHARRAPALSVLFIGTRAYTKDYEALFAGHRFVTMDIDPAALRHGSSQRHVTACASRACEHFEPGSLDLIVFNGVFGWGLNDRTKVEATLKGFHRLLRDGGELIVGWNRIGRHRPFEFGDLDALQAFRRVAFPPLGRAVVDVPGSNRHRFEFFAKPSR